MVKTVIKTNEKNQLTLAPLMGIIQEKQATTCASLKTVN